MDGTLSYFAAYGYVSSSNYNFLRSSLDAIKFWTFSNRFRGMQSVWVMGNATEVLDRVPKPEVEGYLTFGGDVYGNASHWPQVVHFNDYWAENQ